MVDKLDALGRGAAQGATLNFGDELGSRILSAIPMPEDNIGIPRTYAAGSPQADYLATARGKDERAQATYPRNFGAGQFLGGAATAGLAPAAGSIAGAGLVGGAIGGLAGAGAAEEGNRLRGAASGALPGALAGTALPAVSRALSMPMPTMLAEDGSQLPIPGSEPQYWHHSTPSENLPTIADKGIQPAQGGKNFPFAKNKGVTYLTDPESAPAWGEKVADATGKPVTELRTTKPAYPVPGANESVRVSENDIPPERLEMKTPDGWSPLRPKQIPMPETAPQSKQLPLPFDRGNAIRPPVGRMPTGEIEMPSIPGHGKTMSADDAEGLMDQADHYDNLQSLANQRMIKKSSQDASRARPGTDARATTARPPRRAAR